MGRPTPTEIFDRAVEAGQRRLNQSPLSLAATNLIAGVTVVVGIAALCTIHAAVEPAFGEVARLARVLIFFVALVLLVNARAELFNKPSCIPGTGSTEPVRPRRAFSAG